MHVYTDSVCWFVAASLDDAYAVAEEFDDMTREERDRDAGLEECEDSATLGILVNEDGGIDDHGSVLKLTMAEWAARKGRGFLCTTEF